MPKEIPYSPDPDTRLQELAEEEARIRKEIYEREQVLANISARKLKIQQTLHQADAANAPAPPQTPGWPGWGAPAPSRVPVAHDVDPATGRMVEYYDDPRTLSPASKAAVQEYMNRK